jgi:hypothetical protein
MPIGAGARSRRARLPISLVNTSPHDTSMFACRVPVVRTASASPGCSALTLSTSAIKRGRSISRGIASATGSSMSWRR